MNTLLDENVVEKFVYSVVHLEMHSLGKREIVGSNPTRDRRIFHVISLAQTTFQRNTPISPLPYILSALTLIWPLIPHPPNFRSRITVEFNDLFYKCANVKINIHYDCWNFRNPELHFSKDIP